MSHPSADRPSASASAAPRKGWRTVIAGLLAIALVATAVGFAGFLSQLRGTEARLVKSANSWGDSIGRGIAQSGPMASASVATQMSANIGARRSTRTPWRRSAKKDDMRLP